MILVDSNILIYAINTSSPKHTKAQNYLLHAKESFAVSHQNIVECLRVLTHTTYPKPMKTHHALQAVLAITDSMKLLSPRQETISIMKELLQQFPGHGNRLFDLYLVSTMLTHDISTIATDNVKHFGIYKGITVINPFM